MRFAQHDVPLPIGTGFCPDRRHMEFHINARVRTQCNLEENLFSSTGNVIFANFRAVQLFAQKYNLTVDKSAHSEHFLKAGQLNAMGLIDEIFHYVCRQYRLRANPAFFSGAMEKIESKLGKKALDEILILFTHEFPPLEVYGKKKDARVWLSAHDDDGIPNRHLAFEELMLLALANENPAFEPFFPLFNDKELRDNTRFIEAWDILKSWSSVNPPFGPEDLDLISMLKAPVNYSPYNLKGQLEYIRTHWMDLLGEWLTRMLAGIDLISEEEKAGWTGGPGSGTPDMSAYEFGDISKEYERFSPDRDWMPNVVLLAKSVLVWLSQLSVKYQRAIVRLDQIPDEELDFIAQAGFTGLWLIGLWERSPASARIKQICGNPEAAASAYSLDDYEIAQELGGWEALDNLRVRAWHRGIRMASDMVPNHTGMDAKWVVEKPDLFVQVEEAPFPGYDFNGENLSHDGRVGIYLENHYYSKNDCAVVFKRVDNQSGETRYIYHGNDGTGMPWNDTAQVDFLNPTAREQVIQKILHVAKNFPIIRFDAAMVLAKKHIQRLWYPEPGQGGDIASRSRHAIDREEFERRIPEEFWREVVDRCAREIPDTLLLAEAFWMMEGYFVRTLGMHRVYNSAFMNMLKREDNAKYRTTIKNTIEFDPEILKRYVNFMNNPDEETASVQFGNGDKYFGVCTMMVAMPGLPMFGHGQIEGFEEKYGMEYRKAYKDERVNEDLVNRHRHEIFPLMKKRYLFAGVENFRLYDFYENGKVNENVFAWSNRAGEERSLILFNNVYAQAIGWIKTSAAFALKGEGAKELTQSSVAEGLALIDRDGRFCIMQEQRSGLWYIRSTREIFDSGIYAALNGFQTQTFINIYEIDDNATGHYRSLYESLKGNGIANVFMGIQNIYLKNLYGALTSLASPEYFLHIRNIALASPEKKEEQIRIFIKGLEKQAKAFFVVCDHCIDGEFGAYTIEGISKKRDVVDIQAMWGLFSIRLEKLLKIAEYSVKAGGGMKIPSVALLKNTADLLSTQIGMIEVFASALILYSVRDILSGVQNKNAPRELIDLWSLDIKMANILSEYGLPEQIIRDSLIILKELIVHTRAGILVEVFHSVKMAPLLGIHLWDGIWWFNKEKAEQVFELFFSTTSIVGFPKKKAAKRAVLSIKEWNEELLALSKEQEKCLSGFKNSLYRVDSLIALWASGKEKRNTAESKKTNKKFLGFFRFFIKK